MKLLDQKKNKNRNLGFFRFKRFDSRYLLTNDIGRYIFLSGDNFNHFLENTLAHVSPEVFKQLKILGFVKEHINHSDMIQSYALRHNFVGTGTILHIVVVTLRCDHGCIYCQTSSQSPQDMKFDMTQETAENVVDRIFEAPSKSVTIEFQGGEPLLNFETVRFVVDAALEKNKTAKKNLLVSIVSNLASLTQDQCDYIKKNNISVCTSLDGPEKLHNKQRIFLNDSGDGYQKTIAGIKKLRKTLGKKGNCQSINALPTITKYSLPFYKDIIDTYITCGFPTIHLRPICSFGKAKHHWSEIGFTADAYLDFYRKSLDYIISKNTKKKCFTERIAVIFLAKILSDTDTNFLDLRSPCGAGIGQLAYDYDGHVYTCDEGRMLNQMGDASFLVGHVGTHSYQDLINTPVVKSVVIASCLDNLAGCSDCVYKPYCGVCPVYSYQNNGNIFGCEPFNDRCKINKGILDYLFKKMSDQKTLEIFNRWLKKGR